jgi:hypothetical protein
MSKKDSTTKLAIIFVVLLLIVAIIYLTGTGKHERTFKKDIVNIDTARVTEIFLYPKSSKGKEIRLFKDDAGRWMINFDSNKVDNVQKNKVKNLFAELLKIKPERVAARSKKKWDKYEVGKGATRVKIVEDGDTTLDLIVGKFSYKPQSQNGYYYGSNNAQVSTYIRLAGGDEVYEVNGFLSWSFNQNANAWRDPTVIKGDYEKWNRLSFDYPADSSFQLVKENGKWKLNGAETDSATTVKELRRLSRINGSKFVDDVSPDSLGAAAYKLTIEGEKDTIVVQAFKTGKGMVVSSSQNKGTYFDAKNGRLFKRVFVKKDAFFAKKKKK